VRGRRNLQELLDTKKPEARVGTTFNTGEKKPKRAEGVHKKRRGRHLCSGKKRGKQRDKKTVGFAKKADTCTSQKTPRAKGPDVFGVKILQGGRSGKRV